MSLCKADKKLTNAGQNGYLPNFTQTSSFSAAEMICRESIVSSETKM